MITPRKHQRLSRLYYAGLSPKVVRQIARYDAEFRPYIALFCKVDRRFRSYIFTFPYAIVCIVGRTYPRDIRRRVWRLLSPRLGPCAEGYNDVPQARFYSVRELAAAMGVPVWLASLQPEAFGPDGHPPFDGGPGPHTGRRNQTEQTRSISGTSENTRKGDNSPDRSRGGLYKLHGALPRDPDARAAWFRWTTCLWRAGGEEAARWMARQKIFDQWLVRRADPEELALFVHFSMDRHGTAGTDTLARYTNGHNLKPFSPRQKYESAIEAMIAWYRALITAACLGSDDPGVVRLPAMMILGYRFEPVRTFDQLDCVATRLHNCARTYAFKIISGHSVLISISRAGRILALAEIVRDRTGRATCAQLKGLANTDNLPERLRRALAIYLHRIPGCLAPASDLVLCGMEVPIRDACPKQWRALLGPMHERLAERGSYLAGPPTVQMFETLLTRLQQNYGPLELEIVPRAAPRPVNPLGDQVFQVPQEPDLNLADLNIRTENLLEALQHALGRASRHARAPFIDEEVLLRGLGEIDHVEATAPMPAAPEAVADDDVPE